jgi:hypothetical protein
MSKRIKPCAICGSRDPDCHVHRDGVPAATTPAKQAKAKGEKRPYVVIESNIFRKADPPGSGDVLHGSMPRVAIGETLMLTDAEARGYVNKVLSPALAVAQRNFDKAKKEFEALGLQPVRAADGPIDWPVVEPELPLR